MHLLLVQVPDYRLDPIIDVCDVERTGGYVHGLNGRGEVVGIVVINVVNVVRYLGYSPFNTVADVLQSISAERGEREGCVRHCSGCWKREG